MWIRVETLKMSFLLKYLVKNGAAIKIGTVRTVAMVPTVEDRKSVV